MTYTMAFSFRFRICMITNLLADPVKWSENSNYIHFGRYAQDGFDYKRDPIFIVCVLKSFQHALHHCLSIIFKMSTCRSSFKLFIECNCLSVTEVISFNVH